MYTSLDYFQGYILYIVIMFKQCIKLVYICIILYYLNYKNNYYL